LQSDIGIGYGVDIPQISKKIKETVAKVDGVLPDKNIDVWFTEFGESSNTFRVRWWVSSYADKRRSTHDVNTAIQQLSEQMPIDMPNPTFSLDNKVTFGEEGVQQISEALKDPSNLHHELADRDRSGQGRRETQAVKQEPEVTKKEQDGYSEKGEKT